MSTLLAADAATAVYLWAAQNPRLREVTKNQIKLRELPPPGTNSDGSQRQFPALPALTIDMIDNFPLNYELLIERARIQFSCWAMPKDQASLARVAAAVKAEAHYLVPTNIEMPDGEVVRLRSAELSGERPLPVQPRTAIRYAVDVIFTLTTTAA